VVGRAVPGLSWYPGASQRLAPRPQKHFTPQSRVSGRWAQLGGSAGSCAVTDPISLQSAQALLAPRAMPRPKGRAGCPRPGACPHPGPSAPASSQPQQLAEPLPGSAGAAAALGESRDGSTQPCSLQTPRRASKSRRLKPRLQTKDNYISK